MDTENSNEPALVFQRPAGIVPSSINYGTGGSSQPDPNAIESEGYKDPNRLGIALPGRQ